MTEKIDIHKVKDRYANALERFRHTTDIVPRNKELMLQFLHDCEIGKTIKNAQKKRIGPARCLKYLITLKKLSEWIGKPFDEVDNNDMEKFIIDLENNKYLTNQDKPYGEETKADFKKVIKKFYKWLQGNNDHYPELVSWIETIVKLQEIPALSREEIQRMVDQNANVRNKALIKVLFDSGARAEEFLNVRLKHLTKKDDYFMVRIEHSKTKPRTISLPMCTQELDDWLKQHPEAENPEAQLFPLAYPGFRKLLDRIGKRVLSKKVNPHLLRHSSATYYCTRLNPYQLCYRYGWSMASRQPARYIDREGISEQETAKIMKTTTIADLKKTNEEMKEDLVRIRDTLSKSEARNRFVDQLMEAMIKKAENKSEIAKVVTRNRLKGNVDFSNA